jgi:hypothetical protein
MFQKLALFLSSGKLQNRGKMRFLQSRRRCFISPEGNEDPLQVLHLHSAPGIFSQGMKAVQASTAPHLGHQILTASPHTMILKTGALLL